MAIGDLYTRKLERLGRYLVLQVIAGKETEASLIALDHLPTTMPSLGELEAASPLYLHHHGWENQLFWGVVNLTEADLTQLGNLPPKAQVAELSNPSEVLDPAQLERQHYWDQLPSEVRAAYQAQPGRRARLQVSEPGALTAQLAELPQTLSYLHVDAYSSQLPQFLQAHPLVSFLEITGKNHTDFGTEEQPAATWDFSTSHLLDMELHLDQPVRIQLNPQLQTLTCTGEFTALEELACPHAGKFLSLFLKPTGSGWTLPKLPKLRVLSLELQAGATLSLADLAAHYPQLEKLQIHGAGASLTEIAALAELPNLQKLWLNECYGFDAFPSAAQLPKLQDLLLWSIPKPAGEQAKKAFKGIPSCNIRALRTPEWIGANVGNPFATWQGMEVPAAAVKKLISAYKKTYQDLATTPEQAVQFLTEFLQVALQIDEKVGLETLRREQVLAAFETLRESAGVCSETGQEIWQNIFEGV
ncbi:MAG: hypothetical protein Q4D73_00850 [Actinomycetaceae bacterium]|nr:hypothetical protein [Actinomycetaceae bacterium]